MTTNELTDKLRQYGIDGEVLIEVPYGWMVITNSEWPDELKELSGGTLRFLSAYLTESELGQNVMYECEKAIESIFEDEYDDWFSTTNVFLVPKCV